MDLLDQLEASFNSRQVGIVEFCESNEFCSRVLYPRQRLLLKLFFLEELTDDEERILDLWINGGRDGTEIQVSPGIRERVQWCRDNGYKHFRQIVLVGGRRCSKGFLTGLSLAKKVYDCLQLQDPSRYYGIDADKPIMFSCIAAAQQQAKEMQYSDFSAMVNSCAAIQRYIGKMQELEFSVYTESDLRQLETWKRQRRKVMKDTSKLRGNALPANARTIRGSATMALVFDEFAHFMQGESDQSDSEVYAAAIPSLAQFGRDGLIFANSSPFSKVGKFYELFEEGMEMDNGNPASPTTLALRFPSWALFEGWWEDPLYVGPKKCITVSPDWDPNLRNADGEWFYTEDDRQAIIIARDEERSDPQKYKVERRGTFAEVVDAYLIPEMIDRMFKGRPVYENPETGEIQYDVLKTNWIDATYENRYYAHLDPSSTTAGFGFALGHTELYNLRGRQENHVVFDIIKRWNPKEFYDEVIQWEPILEELVQWCDIFRPVSLTMDQHQNQWPMQWLRKTLRAKGIETRVYEKTANPQMNWNRAEVFRTALYQGLVHAPYDTTDNQYAGLELKYLQEVKTSRVPRVDKQEAGPVQTKDMADCIMEVVEALIGNQISLGEREELGLTPLRMGAPGGYPLGIDTSQGKRAELARVYSKAVPRSGEQGFRGAGGRGGTTANPARRPVGGRPAQRRLPGW